MEQDVRFAQLRCIVNVALPTVCFKAVCSNTSSNRILGIWQGQQHLHRGIHLFQFTGHLDDEPLMLVVHVPVGMDQLGLSTVQPRIASGRKEEL